MIRLTNIKASGAVVWTALQCPWFEFWNHACFGKMLHTRIYAYIWTFTQIYIVFMRIYFLVSVFMCSYEYILRYTESYLYVCWYTQYIQVYTELYWVQLPSQYLMPVYTLIVIVNPLLKPIENDALSAKWNVHIWNRLGECYSRLYTGRWNVPKSAFQLPKT
jgi:hypothetical protein